MATFTETTVYVIEHCCNCGIPFAFTDDFYRRVRRDGSFWYCPNGHSQHYDDSENKRRQREMDEANRKLSQKEFELITERNAHAATQRKLSRTNRRIAKGICPCCNRQFLNVARHMNSQHPDYETTK